MKIVQKIVVNRCYGSFGVSEAAARLIATRKNATFSNEGDKDDPLYTFSQDNGFSEQVDELPRTDPDLIAVVEELGVAASRLDANLVVQTVHVEIGVDLLDGTEELHVRGWTE